MDIDMLKSSTDEQFEMMFMMHMDKSDPNSTQMMSFSYNSHHHTNTMAQLYETNPQVALSFPNNNIQNPLSLPNSFPNGSGNGNGLQSVSSSSSSTSQQKQTSMAAMREMIFRIAAMQPIYIDPESVKPPKRRNVRISKDPQSVAARHRRERISERIRILQRLVPGGTKMDTASMLDEAIHYVKFLKSQVQTLERAAVNNQRPPLSVGFPVTVSDRSSGYFLGTGGKANNNYAMGAQAGSTSQYVQQFSDGGS